MEPYNSWPLFKEFENFGLIKKFLKKPPTTQNSLQKPNTQVIFIMDFLTAYKITDWKLLRAPLYRTHDLDLQFVHEFGFIRAEIKASFGAFLSNAQSGETCRTGTVSDGWIRRFVTLYNCTGSGVQWSPTCMRDLTLGWNTIFVFRRKERRRGWG